MMTLTILGSGTGVPSLERSSPAYLLSTPGRRFLVDCGSGALRQLLRSGTNCHDVDGVFVTHTHPDHIGDLIPLIHALKVTPDQRRNIPLRLFGPVGFGAYYEQCVAPVASTPRHFAVEISEVGRSFDVDELSVTTCPTVHSEKLSSVAYRFELDGRSIVVSGDCERDPELVTLARDCDVLVLDCSFPDALKIPGHLSAGECGSLAAQAHAGILVLSHLYPVPPEDDTRLQEARAHCSADVRLARDLITLP